MPITLGVVSRPEPVKHTAEYLKREAKKLKKQNGMQHSAALDEVARMYGYANWANFCATDRRRDTGK